MWLKCNTAEQTLSLKRGQNLCVQTGTRCTKKVLGVCLEREQDHCCFNSILAKLINRQGRSQLGMPMDQCGG
ncbi:conjugal transfer protein TraN, partial [Shewanella sp. AC34-MNA-CIBAN-0136]